MQHQLGDAVHVVDAILEPAQTAVLAAGGAALGRAYANAR